MVGECKEEREVLVEKVSKEGPNELGTTGAIVGSAGV